MRPRQEGFTCPYERDARGKEGIMRAELRRHYFRADRIEHIRRVLADFDHYRESSALQFHVAKNVWEDCADVRELQTALIPFLSDIIAADLELKLYPYLEYQWKKTGPAYRKQLATEELFDMEAAGEKKLIAAFLAKDAKKKRMPFSFSIFLSLLVERDFKAKIKAGDNYPVFGFDGGVATPDGRLTAIFPLLRYSPAAVVFLRDRRGPAEENRNRFFLVTAPEPFYKKGSPRWNESEVVITVIPERLIADVPAPDARTIPFSANIAAERAGYRIKDVETERRPFGMWIPNEKELGISPRGSA